MPIGKHITENYLSEEMIERLNHLNIEVLADEQKRRKNTVTISRLLSDAKISDR